MSLGARPRAAGYFKFNSLFSVTFLFVFATLELALGMPSCTGVKMRLALHGCVNRPFFHIVVAESRFKRNGRHLEQVGSFDPMPNYNNEKLVALNVKRIKYWLGVGVTPTKPVYKILGLAGILPVHPRTYLEADRRRKELATAQSLSSQHESESSIENEAVEKDTNEDSNDK